MLLGAEALVRLTLRPIDSLEVLLTATDRRVHLADRRNARIYEGDPLLFWRLRPHLAEAPWDLTRVTTNAQHLRYPRPVGRKPAGAYRVVCLGDSVTFGYRVPLRFPERPQDDEPSGRPYPGLLEQALRAANPGREIEVIPLAVPGYSSYQGLAWLRRDIDWLAPDLVTACFGWNDICRRAVSDRDAMPADRLRVLARGLTARSQALLRLRHRIDRLRGRPAGPPAGGTLRVPRQEYVSNLLAMAELASRQGARVVLVGPVYRDRVSSPAEAEDMAAHRAALKSAAEARGIPYLEIAELTERSYPENDRLFGELIHPNHLGHRLLAERLGAFLGREGLLGTMRPPVWEAGAPQAPN
ncbi:MAG TPA: SGNH/GDSL hydrolase family protein [Vicinamibacteria bacterium]|nr:SGNH/GDSL hydrolase family protein [Vicinamibacteria bacterium]